MAGFADGVLDPDQWARTPGELARIVRGQLDPEEMDSPGLGEWVASRWGAPVLLDADAVGRWLAAWQAEVESRKMS